MPSPSPSSVAKKFSCASERSARARGAPHLAPRPVVKNVGKSGPGSHCLPILPYTFARRQDSREALYPRRFTSRREDVVCAYERSHSRAHEQKRVHRRAKAVKGVVVAHRRVAEREKTPRAPDRGFEGFAPRASEGARCAEFSACCASRATRGRTVSAYISWRSACVIEDRIRTGWRCEWMTKGGKPSWCTSV